MPDTGGPQGFFSERFDPRKHDVSTFSCGVDNLDAWLREQAGSADARRTARTWVWATRGGDVVGYYALAAHKVQREHVPTRIGRGGPAEIPTVLLARLALSVDLQGKGLGAALVADALERVVVATKVVAARLVVVDALDENAAQFYERLGFRRIPTSMRLVQKISDIEAALG
ncbi:acetyltransferase (GNAT) family protein [Paramicrobacterium agarici]|nr:acetyltransferase (GNAT) family protein [Microbacterium agarici]